MDEFEWIADDRTRTRAAERVLEKRLGLREGEVLLDFPAKTQMLGLDLPVLTSKGDVQQLTQQGLPGAIDLPLLADQLYRSARYLRVFTARRTEIGLDTLEAVVRDGL